jgi:hypothetical protein
MPHRGQRNTVFWLPCWLTIPPLHPRLRGEGKRPGSPPGQHPHQPANLRQEGPEEQPEHVEIFDGRLHGAPACPGDQIGEIGALGLGLGGNLVGGLGLLRFELGNLALTRLAGDRLAEPTAAGLVPLNSGCIKGPVGCPDAFGLAVGPHRRLVG